MPRPESVHLRIYNILGQTLRELYVGLLDAGKQIISWDGRDELGNPVAPGLYFYELRAGAVRLVRRLAVIR